jgi:hypothetical protein
MATILITGGDFEAIAAVRGVVEGMGHFVLHSVTTENVIEDIAFNHIRLVIASESTDPFDAWELCKQLRADPSVPHDLAVLLMHSGDVNPRRYSGSGFTGKLAADAGAPVWSEEIVRQLGEYAAPETTDPLAHSGFD